MKLTKLLLHRSTGTAVAFAISVVIVFAFKPASSKQNVKNTVGRFTFDNSIPRRCISVMCTDTNTGVVCGINGVYQNNTCTVIEPIYIWKP